MKPLFRFLLLPCLVCLTLFPSGAQPPKASPKTSPDDAAAPRTIEELLPASTLGYIVANNLSGIRSSFEMLNAYKVIERRLPKEEVDGHEHPLALATQFLSFGIEDARALDQVRVGAVAIVPEPGGSAAKSVQSGRLQGLPEPLVVAFLEARDLEVAKVARKQFLSFYSENFAALGGTDDVRQIAFKGGNADQFKSGDIGVWVGAIYLLGKPAAVESLYRVYRDRTAEKLLDDPRFMRSQAQSAPVTGIFAYINGKPVNRMFGSALGQLAGGAVSDIIGGSFAELSGLGSIRGVSYSSAFAREGVVDRVSVDLEGGKSNIVSSLISGAPIEFKATHLIPQGTDAIASLSVDWGKFYDEMIVKTFYAMAVKSQMAREQMGETAAAASSRTASASAAARARTAAAAADALAGTAPAALDPVLERQKAEAASRRLAERLKEYEKRTDKELGFSLRDELTKNFGGEISIAFNIPINPASQGDGEQRKGSKKGMAGFIALRDREAAKSALIKYVSYQMEGFGAIGRSDVKSDKPDLTDEGIRLRREKREAAMAQVYAAVPKEIYKGAELLSIPGVEIAFTDDFLIIAESKSTIRQLLGLMETGSVAGDAGFSSAMGSGPAGANFKLFISPRMMDDMINDFIRGWVSKPANLPDNLSLVAPLNAPASLIGFLEARDDGIKLEASSPLGIPGIAAIWGAGNEVQSKTAKAENDARYKLGEVGKAQKAYSAAHGQFGDLETVAKAKLTTFDFRKLADESDNYRIEFKLKDRGKGFEITATPVKYGRQGRKSFYLDETMTLRGGDRNGERAGSADEIDLKDVSQESEGKDR